MKLNRAPETRLRVPIDIVENVKDNKLANSFMLSGNKGKNAAECSNM